MILPMPPLAAIPWFLLPSLNLGPFTIQAFGVITAIGILVGVQLAALLHGLRHREALRGKLMAVMGLVYGTGRFLTDFLRAQLFSIALVTYAVARLVATSSPLAARGKA